MAPKTPSKQEEWLKERAVQRTGRTDELLESKMEVPVGKKYEVRYAIYDTVSNRLDLYLEFGKLEDSWLIQPSSAAAKGKTGTLGKKYLLDLKAKPFEGEAKIAKVVTLHMFSEAETTAWVNVINGSGPIPDKLKKDEDPATLAMMTEIEQNNAATKLQGLMRQKDAKAKVSFMRDKKKESDDNAAILKQQEKEAAADAEAAASLQQAANGGGSTPLRGKAKKDEAKRTFDAALEKHRQDAQAKSTGDGSSGSSDGPLLLEAKLDYCTGKGPFGGDVFQARYAVLDVSSLLISLYALPHGPLQEQLIATKDTCTKATKSGPLGRKCRISVEAKAPWDQEGEPKAEAFQLETAEMPKWLEALGEKEEEPSKEEVKEGDPLLSLKEATAAEVIHGEKAKKEAEAKAIKEAKDKKKAEAAEAKAKKDEETRLLKEQKKAAATAAKEDAKNAAAAQQKEKKNKKEFKYLSEGSNDDESTRSGGSMSRGGSTSRRSKSMPRGASSMEPSPSFLAAKEAQDELDKKIAASYIPRTTKAPLVKEQWANCPKRHGLKLFKVPYDGFSCSRCAQTFAHNPTTLLEGCRICDYDLCQSCAEPVGAWKNPSGEVRSIFYYKPDPPSYVHSVTFDEARAKSEPRKRGELPKDRPPNIKELFDAMDKDDSGTLTRDEVVAAADLLKLSAAEAGDLFDALDTDKSGSITRSEMGVLNGIKDMYVLLFKKKAGALDPHAAPSKATKPKKKKMPSINDLFDVLDANGDGTLTREEVVASSYRLELSQAEAGALFDKLDADKSGALSRQELGVWGGLKGAWDSYRSKSEQRSVAKKEATKEMAKEHIKAGTPSLADLFAILDTDKNGILTRSEVLAGANQLDLSISQAGKLFDELDADGSGTLTKSEVGLVGSMKGVWSRSKKPKEDNGSSSSSPSKANEKSPSAKELFDMLDGDHDGSLTREEVVSKADKLNLTEEEAGDLFDQLDADKSGTLTQQELGLMGSLKGVWNRFKKPKEDDSNSSKASAVQSPLGAPSSVEDEDNDGDAAIEKTSTAEGANKKLPTAKELFEMLDGDHDGSLTREEVVAKADKLNLTEEEAGDLFDQLDADKSGTLTQQELGLMGSLKGVWGRFRRK